MKTTDGLAPTKDADLVKDMPVINAPDASVRIERQSAINETTRPPVTPRGVTWVMSGLVTVCGSYALLQIGNPVNTWVANLVFGAIVLASLTIAGGVLTPFDLRFDRLLKVFKGS